MAGGQRSYRQRCGLALSLDLLGERWTLLVLRELIRGPKRFKDLQQALDGIGPNLLSARLKSLEQAGIAERVTLPAPTSAPAYQLTERGRSLQPILEDLALWGFGLMPPLDEREELTTRAVWAAMTMQATMDRSPDPPPAGIYAFEIGDERFWLAVRDGESDLRDGEPPIAPDATLETEIDGFLGLATGSIGVDDQAIEIDGDRVLLRSLLETFRLPVEQVQPTPG